MKYIIILGDGMADLPIDELDYKTPLEYAKTPNMDRIAAEGTLGLVDTIPDGFTPASDIANLSILGYDVRSCYSGRGALEAASLGVELEPGDIAFRCNLVTLEHNDGLRMLDYTAGQISSTEALEIISGLNRTLGTSEIRFHPGLNFRHLLVWKNGEEKLKTTPPHDITGKLVQEHLPSGKGADFIRHLMSASQEYLVSHPVNIARLSQGKRAATSIWLWGQGKKPNMKKISDNYHLKGAMISAVDLLHGIGKYAGLISVRVPGETDYIDTDYLGQAEYAIKALNDFDFVFVHIEAPDAMGHEGNLQGKIQAIEDIDNKVVGTILNAIPRFGQYRVMVVSDHPTPLSLMTHTADPSPFAILSHSTAENQARNCRFNEKDAEKTGILVSPGSDLFHSFIKGWPDVVYNK